MSFLCAIPPNGGLVVSDHRATSLTGRHPLYNPPSFVGTLEIDSSVFHPFRRASNARYFRAPLISRDALPGGALRLVLQVCRQALHEVESLRPLHILKNRCATPRTRMLQPRCMGREVPHTRPAAHHTAERRMALLRETFARISSERSFSQCWLAHAGSVAKCFIGDNFMRNRLIRA